MIHTLLMILLFLLKLIGIILAVILSLILLILLLVLFCPVRYELQGVSKEQQTGVNGKISWLFHGIVFLAGWDKKEGISYDIHIFGISLQKMLSFIKKIKSRKRNSIPAKEPSVIQEDSKDSDSSEEQDQMEESKPGEESEKQELTKTEESEKLEEIRLTEESEKSVEIRSIENIEGSEEILSTENIEKSEEILSTDESEKSVDIQMTEESKETDELVKTEDSKQTENSQTIEPDENSNKSNHQNRNIVEQLKTMVTSVIHKIRAPLDTIQKAASGINEKKTELENKVQNLKSKVSDLTKFISNARTKNAIGHIKRELIRLLQHCKPRKASGYVHFGFEDPSVTGKILAIVGMTLPIHKNKIRIQPDFENQVIEADAKIKGRIYGVVFAGIGIRLFFDKNLKYVVYKIRHKGKQHG